MSTGRKLVLRDEAWQMEAFPSPAPSADALPITVDTVLLPPQALDNGLWAGHSALSPTTRYTGWGPAMDNLSLLKEDLLVAPQGYSDPLLAALLLPASAIALALEGLAPPLAAGVVGQGLLADLARNLLAHGGFSLEQTEPGADLGLLIDTGGEPGLWASCLPALRAHGILLLFVPPWSRPGNFDFYPHIHGRSLQVMARRWHHRPQALATELVDYLSPIVSRVVRESPWLRPLDLESSPIQNGVWQWLNWTLRGVTRETDAGP